jgi:hypothetical protein
MNNKRKKEIFSKKLFKDLFKKNNDKIMLCYVYYF